MVAEFAEINAGISPSLEEAVKKSLGKNLSVASFVEDELEHNIIIEEFDGRKTIVVGYSFRQTAPVNLLLVCVEEDHRWIAIWENKWFESDKLVKSIYSAPLCINQICANYILRAFELPGKFLSLMDLRQTSPNKLETYAEEFEDDKDL